MQTLKSILQAIDGKGYKSYKQIEEGHYQFDRFALMIDHVQGDPFALPSRISITVPMPDAGFPVDTWNDTISPPTRRIALEDFLGRMVKKNIDGIAKGQRGSGCSGLIDIEINQQKILARNAVLIRPNEIEVRLVIGLPAAERHVAGLEAQAMLFDELPEIIEQALYYYNLDSRELYRFIESAEDQSCLRHQLNSLKLVAFIADGALLPRESGICDRPMQDHIIPFQSPDSLAIDINLPNAGQIRGMGIPAGVTLIVGGGFHGKSTLLQALENGPYNHIPGDGREKVVTNDSAVKIRAEDGRVISRVNISPFIDHLPFGRDTRSFSTENASGSTSQAANIIEALACDAELLLIDEDTSATNFMIRDERMQALVAQNKEPITPLLYRIRELYQQHHVSFIIVMGGSGDYFDVADTVIMMDEYLAHDVTQKAHKLAHSTSYVLPDHLDNLPQFERQTFRKPGSSALDASRDRFDVKINVRERTNILYGRYKVDLAQVEQLIDIGQTRSIGLIIHYYTCHYAQHSGTLTENIKQLLMEIDNKGLDILSPYKVGDLALPRLYEIVAAINRIRSDDWFDESIEQ